MLKKILSTALAALIYAVIGQIVHTIGAIVSMAYYVMPDYASVWSKLMMPASGPPPTSFYLYSLVFGLATGAIYFIVYRFLFDKIKTKGVSDRAAKFTALFLLIAFIPGFFSQMLIINLPILLLFCWLIESAVIMFLTFLVWSRWFSK
jgi:uncharacterized membrane protein (DUF106 family)